MSEVTPVCVSLSLLLEESVKKNEGEVAPPADVSCSLIGRESRMFIIIWRFAAKNASATSPEEASEDG